MPPSPRPVVALALAAGLAGLAAPAAAQATLGFDDVTTAPSATIPAGYGGFQWENFLVQDGTRPLVAASGFGRGVVSPAYVAFNGGGLPAELSSASLFDLDGAYLAAAFNEGLEVRVTGYRGTRRIFTRLLTLDPSGPTWVDLDFLGVSRVRFESSGGVDVVPVGSGTHFVMDDVMVGPPTVTPEPATIALLATGLAGLGLVARRRGAATRLTGRRADSGPSAHGRGDEGGRNGNGGSAPRA